MFNYLRIIDIMDSGSSQGIYIQIQIKQIPIYAIFFNNSSN